MTASIKTRITSYFITSFGSFAKFSAKKYGNVGRQHSQRAIIVSIFKNYLLGNAEHGENVYRAKKSMPVSANSIWKFFNASSGFDD